MNYEVHEQRRVHPPTEEPVRWAIVNGALTFRLGDHSHGAQTVYFTPDGGMPLPVDMREVMDAYLTLRRLHGFGYEGKAVLDADRREEVAQAVVRAAAVIREVVGREEMAAHFEAMMLSVIDAASTVPVPVSMVDPEDFDYPIRAWRGRRVEAEAAGRVEDVAMCDHYIDAWQSARQNVLGELLPEGA